MNYTDAAESFTIFAKYGNGGIFGEEQYIWAGPTLEDTTPEDRARLEALGWEYDTHHNCWMASAGG